MATIAHQLSRLMPSGMADKLRPKWHWHRDAWELRRLGGTLQRAPDLGGLIARRPFGPQRRMMPIIIRSYRELRRYAQFGQLPGDVVHGWLHEAKTCGVLYDVGSANGLEGFLMNHLHGSQVVFIEPYTPSIESILKSIYILGQEGRPIDGFNVVHAGCDEKESYGRLLMHGVPKPGETMNTFEDPAAYCRGGRPDGSVVVSQWLKGVSLDCLNEVYGLPLPTHVKIDVDGFENRVIRGAANLLKKGVVKSWAVEITGEENLKEIETAMHSAGYREVGRGEHYPGYIPFTYDIIYERRA